MRTEDVSVNNVEELPEPGDFDPQATADMLGLSELQLRYCQARLKGLNKTRAAKAAGYSGTDEALRSAGSQAEKSGKVQNFLKLAAAAGAGLPDTPADGTEVKRILSRIARAGGTAAVQACRELALMDSRETAAAGPTTIDPVQALARMASVANGVAVALARALAEGYGIRWADVEERMPRAKAEAPARYPLTDGDRQRERHIERLNQNPNPVVAAERQASASANSGGGGASSPVGAPLTNDHREPAPAPHGLGAVNIYGER